MSVALIFFYWVLSGSVAYLLADLYTLKYTPDSYVSGFKPVEFIFCVITGSLMLFAICLKFFEEK